jgi:hypothetical protein
MKMHSRKKWKRVLTICWAALAMYVYICLSGMRLTTVSPARTRVQIRFYLHMANRAYEQRTRFLRKCLGQSIPYTISCNLFWCGRNLCFETLSINILAYPAVSLCRVQATYICMRKDFENGMDAPNMHRYSVYSCQNSHPTACVLCAWKIKVR